MFGRSGLRVSELCDLNLGDVRLDDRRFRVRDAKTKAGVREVEMTLDVYAQLETRVERRHGTAFDELLSNAKRQLDDAEWDTLGHGGLKRSIRRPKQPRRNRPKSPQMQALREWRDPDSNRGHHDFETRRERCLKG